MNTYGSGRGGRYGMLRSTGAVLFAMYVFMAIAVLVMVILMAMMNAPDAFVVIGVIGGLIGAAVCFIFGMTIKLLSSALSDTGENLDQIQSTLYSRQSGMYR